MAGIVAVRFYAAIYRKLWRYTVKVKAWPGGVRPRRAQRPAVRRRQRDRRFKLKRQPDLGLILKNSHAMGYSPERIAGPLTRSDAPATAAGYAMSSSVRMEAAQSICTRAGAAVPNAGIKTAERVLSLSPHGDMELTPTGASDVENRSILRQPYFRG